MMSLLPFCLAQEPAPAVPDLVRAYTISPPPLEEVRYATAHNFTRHVLYPFPAVFLHRDTAAALQKVQQDLAKQGLGLKIFDGYRPLAIQAKMWSIVPDGRYVSDPAKNKGRHTRGTAVDVTLVDLFGNELQMPTPYDDFTAKAHRTSKNWSDQERTNSQTLDAAMQKHGFIPYPFEWWHYDLKGWEQYPPLDVSFEALLSPVRSAAPPR